MVDAVPNFRQSPLFTEAEKAAMALADAMAGDHTRAPFDEIFAELRKHYGEEQIVELGWRTSVFIGYGRLVYAPGVDAIGAPCRIPPSAAAGGGAAQQKAAAPAAGR